MQTFYHIYGEIIIIPTQLNCMPVWNCAEFMAFCSNYDKWSLKKLKSPANRNFIIFWLPAKASGCILSAISIILLCCQIIAECAE